MCSLPPHSCSQCATLWMQDWCSSTPTRTVVDCVHDSDPMSVNNMCSVLRKGSMTNAPWTFNFVFITRTVRTRGSFVDSSVNFHDVNSHLAFSSSLQLTLDGGHPHQLVGVFSYKQSVHLRVALTSGNSSVSSNTQNLQEVHDHFCFRTLNVAGVVESRLSKEKLDQRSPMPDRRSHTQGKLKIEFKHTTRDHSTQRPDFTGPSIQISRLMPTPHEERA